MELSHIRLSASSIRKKGRYVQTKKIRKQRTSFAKLSGPSKLSEMNSMMSQCLLPHNFDLFLFQKILLCKILLVVNARTGIKNRLTLPIQIDIREFFRYNLTIR